MHLHIERDTQERSPLYPNWVLYNTKGVPNPADIRSKRRHGSPEILGRGLPPWLHWWFKEGHTDGTRPATSCLLFPLTLGGVQFVQPDGFCFTRDGWTMLNDATTDGPLLRSTSGLVAGNATISAAVHGVLWPVSGIHLSRRLAETLLQQHNLWRCDETYRLRWSGSSLLSTSDISEREMVLSYGAQPRLYGCWEVLAAVHSRIMDRIDKGGFGPFFVTGQNSGPIVWALRAGDAIRRHCPIQDVKNRRPPWLRRTERKTPTAARGRRLPKLQGDEHAH